ncbi:MAG: ribosomal protein S18-alanine N-acetyltransferase [Syntrophales bacterium]|nr:ribosomal protein S18-alanine N-acetyltransferase [Syntrophales bacterium]
MKHADIEGVRALEAEVTGKGGDVQQWLRELDKPFATTLVAKRQGGGIIGFINYWLVADEVQIVHIMVALSWRRQGVARKLMDAMMTRVIGYGAKTVVLEVRADNEAAVSLYRQWGFQEVGRRKAYYAPQGGDALLMTLPLDN